MLQQLLYYNLFWSAAWIIAMGVQVHLKYGKGFTLVDPDIARTVLCIFWMLAEPVRLAAGWYGNLQENVPWLVIFAVLTLVPQTAVCYYLMLAAYVSVTRSSGGLDLKPFDQALQVAMAAIIHLELFVTIYAILHMFRAQRKQYYLFEYALQQQHRYAGRQQQ
ncbi:hypothetical protein COO60DRAFT_1634098 [Scenedesmus sp. NREL 46B-D3]|nr:hypothetical protein COO60DRAFT_1634098 [Scenedesmus sp. NREL 46B-D3]